MRIGLISDTHLPSLIHSLDELGPEVGEFLASVELILHGGDISRPSVLDWMEAYAPIRAARGNHDAFDDERVEERVYLEVEGWKIAMAHDLRREDRPIAEIIERCPSDFVVLSGEDHLAFETMRAGGKGVISVTANVAPAAMHEMCRLALEGDLDGAAAVDERLRELHAALFVESNPIPAKWALADMGLIPPGIRLPLTPLSSEYHDRVRRAAQAANTVAA